MTQEYIMPVTEDFGALLEASFTNNALQRQLSAKSHLDRPSYAPSRVSPRKHRDDLYLLARGQKETGLLDDSFNTYKTLYDLPGGVTTKRNIALNLVSISLAQEESAPEDKKIDYIITGQKWFDAVDQNLEHDIPPAGLVHIFTQRARINRLNAGLVQDTEQKIELLTAGYCAITEAEGLANGVRKEQQVTSLREACDTGIDLIALTVGPARIPLMESLSNRTAILLQLLDPNHPSAGKFIRRYIGIQTWTNSELAKHRQEEEGLVKLKASSQETEYALSNDLFLEDNSRLLVLQADTLHSIVRLTMGKEDKELWSKNLRSACRRAFESLIQHDIAKAVSIAGYPLSSSSKSDDEGTNSVFLQWGIDSINKIIDIAVESNDAITVERAVKVKTKLQGEQQ